MDEEGEWMKEDMWMKEGNWTKERKWMTNMMITSLEMDHWMTEIVKMAIWTKNVWRSMNGRRKL